MLASYLLLRDEAPYVNCIGVISFLPGRYKFCILRGTVGVFARVARGFAINAFSRRRGSKLQRAVATAISRWRVNRAVFPGFLEPRRRIRGRLTNTRHRRSYRRPRRRCKSSSRFPSLKCRPLMSSTCGQMHVVWMLAFRRDRG